MAKLAIQEIERVLQEHATYVPSDALLAAYKLLVKDRYKYTDHGSWLLDMTITGASAEALQLAVRLYHKGAVSLYHTTGR